MNLSGSYEDKIKEAIVIESNSVEKVSVYLLCSWSGNGLFKGEELGRCF